MAELSKLGEKSIVAGLIGKFDPSGVNSLGDDCAILKFGNEYLLMTTDMIAEETHIPKKSKPEDIGWYAAAINLSDIAAMGGTPLGLLFALGLPRETDIVWLERLTSGMKECCDSFDIPVLGGDTKENQSLTIAGTAFGRVSKGQILRRSGAKPGDILAMTGKLGRGMLWKRTGDPAHVLRIAPRIPEGRLLAESGAVTSCIDLSDGLSTSLHHLSREGNVGFDVEFESLPMPEIFDGKDREKAIHRGGDYELLFTVNPKKADVLLEKDFGCPVTLIGQVISGHAITLLGGECEMPLPDRGYEHFREAGP